MTQSDTKRLKNMAKKRPPHGFKIHNFTPTRKFTPSRHVVIFEKIQMVIQKYTPLKLAQKRGFSAMYFLSTHITATNKKNTKVENGVWGNWKCPKGRVYG